MSFLSDIRESKNASLDAQSNFAEIELRLTGYEHVQTSSASVWTVTHNLGYRPSGWSLWLDSRGGRASVAVVTHVDNNSLTVSMAANHTGRFKCK